MRRRKWFTVFVLAVHCSLITALTGCESFQRKFTRKPKTAAKPPSPIIQFHDYSQAMTPLERYRKHYLMFSYWHQDLISALNARTPNSKRYRRASEESLLELQTLQGLLSDEAAARLGALIEERQSIDRQLQGGELTVGSVNAVVRPLQAQERQMNREFFWRDVQEQLKPSERQADAEAGSGLPQLP